MWIAFIILRLRLYSLEFHLANADVCKPWRKWKKRGGRLRAGRKEGTLDKMGGWGLGREGNEDKC
jgi:hypothetical protein